MLFCRGELHSANLLCQGLNSFAAASGLCANSSKLAIYLAGQPCAVRTHIAQQLLVDKMTARIRTWYSKNLSYAGRLQLVNSVLMGISTYWCMIFILPKCIIKKVNDLCRSYLWNADMSNPSPGNVSWKTVCSGKKEGCLGIRNLEMWNIVAIRDYHGTSTICSSHSWFVGYMACILREQIRCASILLLLLAGPLGKSAV